MGLKQVAGKFRVFCQILNKQDKFNVQNGKISVRPVP